MVPKVAARLNVVPAKLPVVWAASGNDFARTIISDMRLLEAIEAASLLRNADAGYAEVRPGAALHCRPYNPPPPALPLTCS